MEKELIDKVESLGFRSKCIMIRVIVGHKEKFLFEYWWPLWLAEVQGWLRDTYDLRVCVDIYYSFSIGTGPKWKHNLGTSDGRVGTVVLGDTFWNTSSPEFETHDSALVTGVLKAVHLI
jgi:hypothetical protein